MKRAYSRPEKLLFASPLLLLAIAATVWRWQLTAPPTIIDSDTSLITAMQFSPDSKRLVVFSGGVIFDTDEMVSSGDSKGRIYDTRKLTRILDLSPIPPIPAVNPASSIVPPRVEWPPAWSADGTRIVALYNDQGRGFTKVRQLKGDTYNNRIAKFAVWNARDGQLDKQYLYAPIDEDSYAKRIRFSADGKTLIADGTPPTIFDTTSGARRQVFRAGQINSYPLVGKINEKSGLVAMTEARSSKDGKSSALQVFDPKTKRLIWKPRLKFVHNFGWRGDILYVHNTPGFKTQGTRRTDRILLWDSKSRSLLPAPPIPNKYAIDAISPNPTNQTLAVALGETKSQKHEIMLWDFKQSRELWSIPFQTNLYDFHWSPDGKWLSVIIPATYRYAYLRVFDENGNLCIERKTASSHHIWSPDSSKLAHVAPPSGDSRRIELLNLSAYQ